MKRDTEQVARAAQAIKTIREDRQLTQAELAKKMGVQGSAVGHWEGGNRAPGMLALCALADTLKCSVDALCGRKEASEMLALVSTLSLQRELVRRLEQGF